VISEIDLSVIVATHDRPGHLDRCLGGLATQREAGRFEVIVADDGSGAETRAMLAGWQGRAPFPLRHEWEENRGFRLARARNRGVRASAGAYLIFLDGDCVPPPGFVAEHRAARRRGAFLAGLRYSLDRSSTEALPSGSMDGGELLRRVPRRERLRLIGRAALDRAYVLLRLKDRPKPLGANLSMWRGDLEKVNGFDEKFIGWGLEDEDLARRLSRLGVKKRFAPLGAAVIHLWHPPDPTFRGRASASPNAERFRRGFFLGRCRAGLVPRPLREVRTMVLGLPRLKAHFPQSAGPDVPVELMLRDLGAEDHFLMPRSEVRIGVGPRGARLADFPSVDGLIPIDGDPSSEDATREILEKLEEWL
jgi:glycosyltransferase involved in cell wall biosynthesis